LSVDRNLLVASASGLTANVRKWRNWPIDQCQPLVTDAQHLAVHRILSLRKRFLLELQEVSVPDDKTNRGP
jgi:hypothetical protein